MHPRIAERIVKAAGVMHGNTVLEVGPGRGLLTKALLAPGAHVVAVETDAALTSLLEERFAIEILDKRLTVIHADIRNYLAGPAKELRKGYAVVANIPYYLTGELIRLLLTREHQPRSMTLLVQKEVAERIVAVGPERSRGARDKKENLLSLSIKAYGTPHYEFTVPKGAFRPAPSVDSAVLSIRNISRDRFASRAEESRFFELIRAGFAHKRKYLRSNLAAQGLPAEGVAEKARAEDLSLDAWVALSQSR